jgi:glyoxylate carboligase
MMNYINLKTNCITFCTSRTRCNTCCSRIRKSDWKGYVAIATSGPGATNLVTGIADAQIDSTPMVCITGQVGKHLLGSDAFQETDIIGISTPVTKWNYQITEASEIRKWQRHFTLQDQAVQDQF